MKKSCMYAAVLAVIVAGVVAVAAAATFTVSKTADTNDGTCDADCSLREAVIAANANAGADDIVLPAGTYTLTIAGIDEDLSATGDLDLRDDVTISGAGAQATIIDGDAADRILEIFWHLTPSVVAVSDLTLRNGNATDFHGVGSAIGNAADADLTLSRVSVRSNDGFSALTFNSGTLTISDCTFSGNLQGGILIGSSVVASLTNTTVSNNQTGENRGGGISVGGVPGFPAVVTLNNVTVADNSNVGMAQPAGLDITNNSTTVTVSNSIFSGNTSVSPGIAFGANCGGTSPQIVSAGHNLSDDGSCLSFTAPGDLPPPVNADLEPLADNGGPTQTRALGPLSEALDQGSAATPGSGSGACEATDQRGTARPQAGRCDIGALERVPVVVCGDGFIEGGEECDDHNTTGGDGCSATCTDDSPPESSSDPSVAAGETFGTDSEADGATGDDPVESSLTVPVGEGSVSIAESLVSSPPAAGFTFLNQQVDIEFNCASASCPSAAQPLVIVFLIDASRVPAGEDEQSLQVFRNGALVGDCSSPTGTVAAPDPCVNRSRLADGDVQFRVYTSHASQWNFAAPDGLIAHRVGGKKLLIKDNTDPTKRTIIVLSKSAEIAPGTLGGPNDPTCTGSSGGGGRLQVFGTGGSGQSVDIALPCSGWTVVGKATAPRGYKYSDASQAAGPCKLVKVMRGKLVKAVCNAKNATFPLGYDLGAGEGSVGVLLTTGEQLAHCAEFGGTPVKDTALLFKALDAAAPATCPAP